MTTLRRILVPVDFTEGSLAALREASELATTLGSHLHVLHVAQHCDAPPWAVELFGREVRALGEAGGVGALDRLATVIVQERLDPFKTTGVVRKGNAVDAIAEYADQIGASLIVMGVHGDHLAAPNSVGRVIAAVIGRVRCPVMAIPAEPAHLAAPAREAPQAVGF